MLLKYSISIMVYSFMSAICFSQNSIVAKSFVKDNVVYIRYLPDNSVSLKKCLLKGYEIKKISWSSNEKPDSVAFKNVPIAFTIKPADKTSFEWEIMVDKYDEASFLFNYLFESNDSKNKDPEMAFGLAMLSCDFNTELAKTCGLFIKDDKPLDGKSAYIIQPADVQLRKTIAPAIIVVNAAKNDELKNIDTLKIKTHKKEVKLFWNEKILNGNYAGYWIERSEDGKIFVVLNKKPHIQVNTQYEKDKKDIYYNDTITEYGKTYYYRVKGLNHFGVTGNYSNVVECKLIKPLDEFPLIDSVHLVRDSTLQICWHMPDKFDLKELKGYNLYRSINIKGEYKKINSQLILSNEKKHSDPLAKESNYYIIVAYNNYGDSASSHPFMGLVPDKFPPKTPAGLKGKIDTTGKVVLTWSPNKENDLLGYRIFKNNATNEEKVEITKTFIKDTAFRDTITLETLTEEVYYYITAVDKVYNNSKISAPVKLKRPDKIKPVEAQIKSITHNDSSIALNWTLSTSKDVIKYELYRKKSDANFEKIKEWNNNTDSIFIDTKLEYANYYTYQIKTWDDDGNFSISTPIIHYYDSRVRKQIKDIKFEINNEKKLVVLNWKYSEKELYNFVIYKAKKGEAPKAIKTLKPNEFYFEDKDVMLGNKYVYQIKANFISGSESYISDEITIDF